MRNLNLIASIWAEDVRPVLKTDLKFRNENEERLYDLVCRCYEIRKEIKALTKAGHSDAAIYQTVILANVDLEILKLIKNMRGIDDGQRF